jgi:hypothetical protein
MPVRAQKLQVASHDLSPARIGQPSAWHSTGKGVDSRLHREELAHARCTGVMRVIVATNVAGRALPMDMSILGGNCETHNGF